MTPKHCQALCQCPLFQGMTLQQAQRLAQEYGQLQSFPKGVDIYRPDQYRRAMGVLVQGRAQVFKPEGESPVPLNLLGPGQIFGVASLFHASQQYVTQIQSLGCVVLFFSEEALRALFAQSTEFTMRYIAFLTERICFLNHKIDAFTAGSALEKAARGLLTRWQEQGGEGEITFVNAAHMARALNMGRASLYRAFDALEELGLIQRRERQIQVLDRKGLEQAAVGEFSPQPDPTTDPLG